MKVFARVAVRACLSVVVLFAGCTLNCKLCSCCLASSKLGANRFKIGDRALIELAMVVAMKRIGLLNALKHVILRIRRGACLSAGFDSYLARTNSLSAAANALVELALQLSGRSLALVDRRTRSRRGTRAL